MHVTMLKYQFTNYLIFTSQIFNQVFFRLLWKS